MSDQIVMKSLDNIINIFTEIRKENRDDSKLIKESLQTAEKNSTEAWKDIKQTRERTGIMESKAESISKRQEESEEKIEEIEKNMIRIWGNGSQNPTGVIAIMQQKMVMIEKDLESFKTENKIQHEALDRTSKTRHEEVLKRLDKLTELANSNDRYKTKLSSNIAIIGIMLAGFVSFVYLLITVYETMRGI